MQSRTITGLAALTFLLLLQFVSFYLVEMTGVSYQRVAINYAEESARKYRLKNTPTFPPLPDLLARLRSRIIASGDLLLRKDSDNTWTQSGAGDFPKLLNQQMPRDFEVPDTDVQDVVLDAQQEKDEGPISEVTSQTEDYGDVENPTQPHLSPEDFTKCVHNCRTTQEINPVCGDDGVTYGNIDKLICAQHCGKAVHSYFVGHCEGHA